MNCRSEASNDNSESIDFAWQLLLDGQTLTSSSQSRPNNTSNEIKTSQLAKLFQGSDEATRRLIELYQPWNEFGANGFVVGHLGQSLDGRIAALNGASRWITGEEDVVHNHRMRALSDAVVVGAGTVRHDDPKLTVRAVEGRSAVRVVIDPGRRLSADYALFSDGEVETILLCREEARRGVDRHGKARIIGLPETDGEGGLSPEAVVERLRLEGLSRIFIEGGGLTVSRFLERGCLDRLQITVAPIILGSGRPSITLPEITDVADSLRPDVRMFRLGADMLFECCFDRSDRDRRT